MCGRVTQSSGPLRLAIVEGLDVSDSRMGNIRPRYNAAPRGAAPGSPSQVVGYVRHATGTGRDNTAAQITSVSGSDISARIRDALDWIKANVPGDPMIRVLTAPAYQMTALGLYAGETLTGILLVTPSDGLPIENEHVYTPSEFRQLLGSVVPTSGLRR